MLRDGPNEKYGLDFGDFHFASGLFCVRIFMQQCPQQANEPTHGTASKRDKRTRNQSDGDQRLSAS